MKDPAAIKASDMRDEVVFYRQSTGGGINAPAEGTRTWSGILTTPAFVRQIVGASIRDDAAAFKPEPTLKITCHATNLVQADDLVVFRNIAAKVVSITHDWANAKTTFKAHIRSDNATEYMSQSA